MAPRKHKDESRAPAAEAARPPEVSTGGVPPVEATTAGEVPAATDAPREQKLEGGARNATGSAAPGGETMITGYPPPPGIPAERLAAATLVVKAKPERGRRRAGHSFTREETEIPLADLTEDQRAAIAGDRELVVALRLAKPA